MCLCIPWLDARLGWLVCSAAVNMSETMRHLELSYYYILMLVATLLNFNLITSIQTGTWNLKRTLAKLVLPSQTTIRTLKVFQFHITKFDRNFSLRIEI